MNLCFVCSGLLWFDVRWNENRIWENRAREFYLINIHICSQIELLRELPKKASGSGIVLLFFMALYYNLNHKCRFSTFCDFIVFLYDSSLLTRGPLHCCMSPYPTSHWHLFWTLLQVNLSLPHLLSSLIEEGRVVHFLTFNQLKSFQKSSGFTSLVNFSPSSLIITSSLPLTLIIIISPLI